MSAELLTGGLINQLTGDQCERAEKVIVGVDSGWRMSVYLVLRSSLDETLKRKFFRICNTHTHTPLLDIYSPTLLTT